MRTEVGVRQECEKAGKGLASNGRALLAYSLAAVLSTVVMGGDASIGRANPVKLASYNPAENFVALSLKNSSTIAATVPQETLSSRYEVVSNSIETTASIPSVRRASIAGKIFAPEAACRAGGMFDACPTLITLLLDGSQGTPRVIDVALPSLKEAEPIVPSASEKVGVLTEGVTAPVGRVETNAPDPSNERTPIDSEVAESITAQAACETGGLFDECPGFLALLHSRQEEWPRLATLDLPAANERKIVVASVNERVSLFTNEVDAPVDEVWMRAGEAIVGVASTYNPYDKNDKDAGNGETASGELYDPIAWTAAIQIKLRKKFAGVRYGRLYKPSFALVELNGKRAIVKINDVGPLRPGRVIDFSRQVMHYFDPSLQLGILAGARVTPLIGSDWTPGPLGTTPTIAVASSGP